MRIQKKTISNLVILNKLQELNLENNLLGLFSILKNIQDTKHLPQIEQWIDKNLYLKILYNKKIQNMITEKNASKQHISWVENNIRNILKHLDYNGILCANFREHLQELLSFQKFKYMNNIDSSNI